MMMQAGNKPKTSANRAPRFRLAHIGINVDSSEEILNQGKLLASLLGQQINGATTENAFVGELVELCRDGKGRCGHIGFSTDDLSGALEHLKQLDMALDSGSFVYDCDGRLRMVYLQEEIAGFAIHFTAE